MQVRKRLGYQATVARTFCDLLSNCETSVAKLLAAHPEFPSLKTLYKWRDRKPDFARRWQKAREQQAEHLVQKCFDLAKEATPKTAHQARVRFDIYRWWVSKILPNLYGDKPAQTSVTTNVALVVSPQRLDSIRANLERSRGLLTEERDIQKKQEDLPESLKAFDLHKALQKANALERQVPEKQERLYNAG